MSDEVSQFLEQVEKLRGQQVEDDQARAREREEYMAAKRERQARREERARSISPQKSPTNTPSPRANVRSINLSDAVKLDADSRQSSIDRDVTMPYSESATKENEAPMDVEVGAKPGSTSPNRDSPSWQRRPASRGASRPLSMVATQNATQRFNSKAQDPTSPPPAEQQQLSREDIARTLGLKDPSWFRQTPDRGRTSASAAYRKNQVEDEEKLDMSSLRAQLPGMSAAVPAERSPSRASFISPSQAKLASPIPLNPPRHEEAETTGTPAEASPTHSGRSSPVRSASPTKGMGGFVQSAMLKRSDSVKRWSVTSPPSLSRADSVTASIGNRSSVHSSPRPRSFMRADSAASLVTDGNSDIPEEKAAEAEADAKLPTSPSKTMDSRRWSPTKSSWLDSALNRPETPTQQQSRHVKSPSTQFSRPESPHKQVNVGGLMRSTPFEGGGKTNTTGLGGIYSPPPGGNRPPVGHGSKPSISQVISKSEKDQEAAEEKEHTSKPASEESSPVPDRETKRTPVASPPPIKPKPVTPPKKDFRSNLKPRAVDSGPKKDAEPEFRNALGNLRRTKTQNYVAPDELKSNIMRGKAALSVTGGPQKSTRTDEFKDAILKKRDDFKQAQTEGRGITRVATVTENKLPEGLAKRAELGKPSVAAKPSTFVAPKKADPAASLQEQKPEPKIESKVEPKVEPSPSRSFASKSNTSTAEVSRDKVSALNETKAPVSTSTAQSGGKLANRFNPGLAGLLARGPPPMAVNGGKKDDESNAGQSTSGSVSEPSAPGPQLTHMTKNRARGPRRKAPSAATAQSKPAESMSSPVAETPITNIKQETPLKPTVKPTVQEQVAAAAASRSSSSQSPTAVKTEPKKSFDAAPASVGAAKIPVQSPVVNDASPISSPSADRNSTKKLDTTRMSHLLSDDKPSSPKDSLAGDSKPSSPSVPAKKEELNALGVKSPESNTSKPASPEIKPKPSSSFTSPRSAASPHSMNSPHSITSPLSREQRERSSPSMATPSRRFDSVKSPSPERRPTLYGPRPPSGSPRPRSRGTIRPLSGLSNNGGLDSGVESPAPSPVKKANDITTIFNDFFGPPRPRKDFKVETTSVLADRSAEAAKVSTADVQTIRITGDGKNLPIQQQFERVLFEDEMYIIAHSFARADGKKEFEVYFWIGDGVSEAEASDAHVFAQGEANSVGGKLVKLYQGKETTEFVQALGGVIITRRGSSDKFDSLGSSMLCGRRYMNQVAFDEIDSVTASLCAGFVYIVSHSGQCYLWKGKGAGVDELSAAKLVGMEIAVMGELVEVDEGNEPDQFWKVFDGGHKPHSADHWRLKPNYEKYGSRLFCSDADARKQIAEISPFGQTDLSPMKIYVLDAFFEMYVIVGSGAQSQYSSFRNALDFAQEYAILCASMEDRPFVPVSTIVLEGIPRDLKRVFRKWTDERSPTVTNTYSGLKRGRSLRIVSLTQALQAFNE